MGDVRYGEHYDRVARASDPSAELRRLSDQEAAAALGAASRKRDPYLANVLATDVLNRIRQKDSILAHLADGILVTDAEGRITAANRAVETLTGWTERALVGRDLHHALCYRAPDGEFRKRGECPLVRTLGDSTPRQGRGHLVRQDGSILPVTYTSAAVVEDDMVVGSLYAFQDARGVTEGIARREREARRYRRLVERGPAYMYVARVGERGETQWLCPQFEALLERAPDDWSHDVQLRSDLIHPDDRQRVDTEWRQCIETGRRFVSEYRVRLASGRTLWLHDEAVAIHTETGAPVEFFGAMLDVTERKQAEEARERRRMELERVVLGLAEGVTTAATFVFETSGRIAFANRAAERIFGRTREEFARLDYDAWGSTVRTMEGDLFPREARPFRRAMREGGAVQDVTLRIERPDGTSVLVRADAVPVRDPQSGDIVSVVGTFVEKRVEE